MADTQVLIVGAGPTGLVLAHHLARQGLRIRIIDQAAEPGTTSRAIVMHARSLEFYQQLGLADDVVKQGRPFAAANIWVEGKHKGRIRVGDMGQGLSPFPFVLIYPQDEHEAFLSRKLEELGVKVERSVTLEKFQEQGDRVVVKLRHPNGQQEVCSATYIAGCDGAHSTVRKYLGFDFAGAMYSRLFYVADIEADGPYLDGELHLSLDNSDFIVVFPLKRDRTARLIGTVLSTGPDTEANLSWESVGPHAVSLLKMNVEKVNWFSTYRVHHRMASHFRHGRAFLLGDAAHIHSPVGGQGMNTGIGDAVNLAWKLTAVLQGTAEPELLDTYEPERIAFARRLVATTDRAFNIVSSDGPLARLVRTRIAPWVLPKFLDLESVRRYFFRTLSQIGIEYRDSALSEGTAGAVHAGDRLPWTGDNFKVLQERNWQIHVYGEMPRDFADTCRHSHLAVHVFTWSDQMEKSGLRRNAAYLMRPDGHVAWASADANSESLSNYLSKGWRKVRPLFTESENGRMRTHHSEIFFQ